MTISTNEEVLRLAKQAGFQIGDGLSDTATIYLVRDIGRYIVITEQIAKLVTLAKAAGAKEEREACAELCKKISDDLYETEYCRHSELRTDAEAAALRCAHAIEARGDQ